MKPHRDSPQRIASLLAGATEMLYALGLGERVVAISHECDYPREAVSKPRATVCRIDSSAPSSEIDSQVRCRLKAGLPLYQIDRELLGSLRPDLIVTQAQCDVCAVRFEEVAEAVQCLPELAGTKIIPLNPASLDDILEDIRRVGQAAGVDDHARSFVASLRQRIERIRHATQGLPAGQRPRVVCIEWIEPLMLAANWMPELLEIAGARPVHDASGRPSRYHAWREVVELQPEAVIIMPCGFDARRAAADAKTLTQAPGWSDLPAVRQGRVFAVDAKAYFNRPGPRIVESLELLAHLLHPELLQRAHLSCDLAEGNSYIRLI